MTAATVPALTDDEIDVIWEGVPDCSMVATYEDQRRFARAVLEAVQPVLIAAEPVAWTRKSELEKVKTIPPGYACCIWGERIDTFIENGEPADVPLYTHPAIAQPVQPANSNSPGFEGIKTAQPVQSSQGLSLHLLLRLSTTLTRLGYATPEGGMEHFSANLAGQLYNLCQAVDNIFDRAQPVPPKHEALSDANINQMFDMLFESSKTSAFNNRNWFTAGVTLAETKHGIDIAA